MIIASPVKDCEIFYEYNYSESIAYHETEARDEANANTRDVSFFIRIFSSWESHAICIAILIPAKKIILDG